ncbi:MAG TPA: protein-methionine-sulfoxide reductase heme-binding subunit MsrQ [Candidatus Acidoferrum sp.]|nr:protein-methionine-sulfoxide reductase heme-binding subunit MsrQ [Candidatus Acidoferrum sp.]
MLTILANKWAKVPVFLLCLVPLGILVWRGFTASLGANPVEFIQHATGDWTLRFLVLTLCITPFRKLLKLPDLIRFRRMLGLFAFLYACLHFLTYLGPDQSFDLASIWKDIAKRPFITVGFTAFILMIPLALTSTAGWIRRLGGSRWQMLHRLIYISAICGVIHYYWLVKSAVLRPLTYGAIVAALLLWRVIDWFLRRGRAIKATAKTRRAPANT